jgi:hypothetical protein
MGPKQASSCYHYRFNMSETFLPRPRLARDVWSLVYRWLGNV